MRKRFARKAPAPLDGAPGGSDSDVSLMSDVSDGEAPASPPVGRHLDPPGPGPPTCWAEVDAEELQRVAHSIARSFMPELERADPAPPAAEVDSDDPLGLGHLDPRTLALTQDAPAASGARYSARINAEGALRAKRLGGCTLGSGDAPASLHSQLLPSSERFDPELYLATVHGATQLGDLLRGLSSLRAQLNEHAGQLKALVKENFGRFISSKDTIDDVAAKLRAAEAEGGVGVNGATPGEVAAAVARAQEGARRAFGPLLERRARAERLQAVLGLLDSQSEVVSLASRVRRQAESGDFVGVVQEYKRARGMLAERGSGAAATAAGPDGGGVGGGGRSVWDRLMSEVDKVVSSVVHTLETVLKDPQAAPSEVADAMKHLTQLRAAGAPAAAVLDPLSLFVEVQERQVSALLAAQAQAWAAWCQQRQRRGEHGDTPGRPALGGSGAGGSAALAVVDYVAAITGAVASWAPRFWDLTHVKAPQLLSEGAPAEALDAGMAAAERCMATVLRRYTDAVEGVLEGRDAVRAHHPATDGGVGHEAALAVADTLVAAFLEVRRQGAPAEATRRLQALVALAGRTGGGHLRTHLRAAAAALCSAESWPAGLVRGQRRQPATVTALRRLVSSGLHAMAELQAVCGRAGVDPVAGPPPCPPHELLCLPLSSYAEAAAGAGPDGDEDAGIDSVGRDSRVLAVCSSLWAAREEVLPQLAAAWAPLLASGATPEVLQAALAECAAVMEGAEDVVMAAYIERKQALLDGIMEDFFFSHAPSEPSSPPAASSEWELALPPRGVRPAALDLLAALGAVQAELALSAPTMLRDAMRELLEGLLAGIGQVVATGLPGGGLTPGGVCQLWLEVSVLQEAVGGLAAGDEGLAGRFLSLQGALEEQLRAAVRAASSAELQQLSAWCQSAQVDGDDEDASLATCQLRVQQLCASECAAAHAVIHPLRLLAPTPLPS